MASPAKNRAIIAPSVSKYLDVKPVLTSVSKSISNDSPDFLTSILSSIFFEITFLIVSEICLKSCAISLETALISTSVSFEPAVSI